eukprot:TRINITY_DN28562_c0_g1_i1.p1 TRINITY_DN28562_c0_g1~~TRINITY_DN28562_c0_g1_i1.p1  ORF type:complete len:221 (-),score=60.09 TRINITY_DN28562_c0_g1_i1:69-731(-)
MRLAAVLAVLAVLLNAAAATAPTPPQVPPEFSSNIVEIIHDGVSPVYTVTGMLYLSRSNQAMRLTASVFGDELDEYVDYQSGETMIILQASRICQKSQGEPGSYPPADALANATYVGQKDDPATGQTIFGWQLTHPNETLTVWFNAKNDPVREEAQVQSANGGGTTNIVVYFINPQYTVPSTPNWFTIPACPFPGADRVAATAKSARHPGKRLHRAFALF